MERRKPSALTSTLAGALAGAVSRFATGPLDVLKIRFQIQLEPIVSQSSSAYLRSSKYTSMRQALVTIIKEEGIQVCRFLRSYVTALGMDAALVVLLFSHTVNLPIDVMISCMSRDYGAAPFLASSCQCHTRQLSS